MKQALRVELPSGSAEAESAKARLLKLDEKYGLARWRFTDRVRIVEEGISHSHPVLTLSLKRVRIATDDELLCLYLHEQMHWYLEQHSGVLDKVLVELRKIYPSVKVGYPEGAMDEVSSYLHIAVCLLEYSVASSIIGKEKARRVLENMDHYTWIYSTVLRDSESLTRLLHEKGLTLA